MKWHHGSVIVLSGILLCGCALPTEPATGDYIRAKFAECQLETGIGNRTELGYAAHGDFRIHASSRPYVGYANTSCMYQCMRAKGLRPSPPISLQDGAEQGYGPIQPTGC
jgi:hypothetical protein